MKILRRKVELRQPYAGLFLKKDKTNEKDTVDKLSDIYDVGAFCQIQEFQDLGDKLRMIVIAHRRIRIVHQLYEDVEKPKQPGKKKMKLVIMGKELNISEDDDDASDHQTGSFKTVKRRNPTNRIETIKDVKLVPLTKEENQPVVMVEVENVKTIEQDQSDEVKALTQEVIKTLREIITSNTLYRENLQHMISQNQRVVNNPSYLCDLGASLSSAEPADLQEVLHEEDVSWWRCEKGFHFNWVRPLQIAKRLRLTLALLKKEAELTKLQKKIGDEVEEKVKTQHRKYILQEQLKVTRHWSPTFRHSTDFWKFLPSGD